MAKPWIERGDNMQRILKDLTKVSLPHPHKNVFTTTLYELVEAVNEEVQPEEKRLVPEIVIDLLNTCRSNCWVQ
jgi:uncharacterized FlgJ-related protein